MLYFEEKREKKNLKNQKKNKKKKTVLCTQKKNEKEIQQESKLSFLSFTQENHFCIIIVFE